MIRRILLALAVPLVLRAQTMPELPRASVDTRISSPVRTIRVPANDAAALQSALDSAIGGDEIVLPDRARYVGAFVLPQHVGTATVTLRSETVPAPGVRVTPEMSATFASLVRTSVEPAIGASAGAAGWRIVGIAIRLEAPAWDNYGLVVLGVATDTTPALYVRDIVLDRVFITAGEISTSRCVALNGAAMAVVNSWLEECHSKGRDAQAIGGWSGAGPFLIENNTLQGSGMAVMFGGGDPRVKGLVPSDIIVRRNWMVRPLSWGNGKWTVKATFELKNAQRVLVEANVMEYNWLDAQVGYLVLFQGLNQDNTAPWSKVWDVTFRDNLIRGATGGVNILSTLTYGGRANDDPMRRVLFQNNLFTDIGRDPITGSEGKYLQLLGDHEDVTFENNTFLPPARTIAQSAISMDGKPSVRLTLRGNVFGASTYGLFGSGSSEGTRSLAQYAPDAVVTGNVIAGRIASLYPPGNEYPASVDSTTPGGADRLRIAAAIKGVIRGSIGAPVVLTPPVAVIPPPIVEPPITRVLTCEGAPLGFVLRAGSEVTTARSERVEVRRGAACVGVTTLAAPTRYAAHVRTSTGWRTIAQQYGSRAAAAAAVVAANGR